MKYILLAIPLVFIPVGAILWIQASSATINLSSEAFLRPKNIGGPALTSSGFQSPPSTVKSPALMPATTATKPGIVPTTKAPEATLVKNLFIADCNCYLPGDEPRSISYEDEKTCGADRNYLSKIFNGMPDWMKEVRNPFPEAHVGRECVALVMRTFLSSGQKFQSSSFAHCASSTSAPVRGVKIPCVTEDYVNTTYNALVDVSDCLNIPQADLVVKLSNESGLHINTYGPQGDAGIGQLTGYAIGAVLEPYWKEGGNITVRDYYVQQMKNSSKESCKRIMSSPMITAKVSLAMGNRCSLMNPPENPYRNLLYTGLYYRILLHDIAGVRYQNGNDFVQTTEGMMQRPDDKDFKPGGRLEAFDIRKNLIALGIKSPDMRAVERAVTMLGYNAGPAKAAEYFSVYLKKRLQAKKWLTPADVDFLSTDFMKNWQKIVGGRAKKASKLPPALASARKIAYTKSLPEFLMIIQDSGSPGYLSKVALKHKELLQQMGDERCVSPNFIHF